MQKNKNSEGFRLKLKGRTIVFVDWANVYGWNDSLKTPVDPYKLLQYFQSYKEVKKICLYFGLDKTRPESQKFLDRVNKMGYEVVSKDVKFIKIFSEDKKTWVLKRKCDFDLEIGLDALESMGKYDCFIFVSGDGDFATIYQRLIKIGKQVIVIYTYGHLGREIWEMKRGIFKAAINKLEMS